MKYRIKNRAFFVSHAGNAENYVTTATGKTRLYNPKMNKYCNTIIETEETLDQHGNICLCIKDNEISQTWYFYDGWYDIVIERSIILRRGKYTKKGFQLCFIE